MATMRRFYFPPENRKTDTVELTAEESRHALKVLRLAVGDRAELFDGSGAVYLGKVTDCSRRVTFRIERELEPVGNPGRELLVYQGVLRGEKMDQVVQKCTELGVARLYPVYCERSQGRFDRDKSAKKVERWQRISLEACKQCLRPRPMEILPPQMLTELLGTSRLDSQEEQLLFWEGERECTLRQIVFSGDGPVSLLFGPEGGFTEDEVQAAGSSGWRTVSLGRRILRAETASLAGVSLVQYLVENL